MSIPGAHTCILVALGGDSQLAVEPSAAGLTGLRWRVCRWIPEGAGVGGGGRDDPVSRQGVEQVLINLASASARGKGFSSVAEPVKDPHVTAYVLQLLGVSDQSLETPLFVFFPHKVMKSTVFFSLQMR